MGVGVEVGEGVGVTVAVGVGDGVALAVAVGVGVVVAVTDACSPLALIWSVLGATLSASDWAQPASSSVKTSKVKVRDVMAEIVAGCGCRGANLKRGPIFDLCVCLSNEI